MQGKITLQQEFVIVAVCGGLLLLLVEQAPSDIAAPLLALRLLLTIFLVLLVPGYWLQAFFFPREGDLAVYERLALSMGLSVAIMPPIALVLDLLPFLSIRQWYIIGGEGLAISISGSLAWYRRSRLKSNERFLLKIEIGLRRWWQIQSKTNRGLYFMLGIAMSIAIFASASILLRPGSAERFTEFYLLTSDRYSERYPYRVNSNEPVSVTIGITNYEGYRVTYSIAVLQDQELLYRIEPFTLEHEENFEEPIKFTPSETGQIAVDFLLYRDRRQDPYRSARLYFEVIDTQTE